MPPRYLSRAMTAGPPALTIRRVPERRVARAVALALLLGIAAQYLFFEQLLGLNFTLVVALFLAAAVALRAPGVRTQAVDLWLPLAALAFATFCAVRVDVPLLAFDVLAAVTLATASVAALAGVPVSSLAIGRLIGEALWQVARAIVGAADALAVTWPRARILPSRLGRASGLASGVGLAAPFMVVFTLLFSSADAVFARSLEDLVDVERLVDMLRDAPGRILIALAVAWPAAGLLVTLWRTPRDYVAAAARSLVAADTATVALVVIDLLFAAFVVLQVTYLFGGRDTLDASGLTYAEYGRRGFFELVAVVVLVALLLFGLDLALGPRRRAYRAAALVLVGLSGAVLASANYRMDLYQGAYGWSELRFYVFAANGFLACALALFAWAVACGRMAFIVQPLVAVGVVVALAANVIGPSGFIARENLDRFLDPSGLPEDAQRSLDVHTLWWLGDGALPDIIERLDLLPPWERAFVADHLRWAVRWRNIDGDLGWQGWNADRERARAALVRWRDGLRDGRSGPR